MRPRRNPFSRRGGFAQILALLILCIFSALAVSFAASSNMNLRSSDNYAGSAQARLVAESGLAFMLNVLGDLSLPVGTTESNLLANLQSALATRLGPTANLSGGSVSYAGGAVNVGPVPLDGGSFLASLQMVGSQCQLTVTGTARNFSRRVGIKLDLTERASGVFDYGVASRGRIVIKGSAVLDGMADPSEASVLSTKSTPVAIEAGGHASIGGDLFVTGEEGDYVLIYGNGLSVGGTSDIDEIINNHVHLGVAAPEWPEVDTSPFSALTSSVIDETTNLDGAGLVFNNVRIVAGTDPSFKNDAVLNGVIYIEAPNKVTFNAGVTINGIIVTEEDEAQTLEDCQIDFRGHVSAPGVDALPDTEEFAQVKLYRGTVILAPGFSVSFRGASAAANGTIAADELSFLGNTTIEGEIEGSVLGLRDRPLTLSGNCGLRFNRANADTTPAGFSHPIGLRPLADTYAEIVGAG